MKVIDKIAAYFAMLMNKLMNFIANVRDFILALFGKIEFKGVIG